MLPEQKQRILCSFIEDSIDNLSTIEQGLLNLHNTIINAETLDKIFRAAQSLTGGAAMLEFDSIQQTAHHLEVYFKVLKDCPRIQVDQKLESLFLRVFDTLQELLEQLADSFSLAEDVVDNLMSEVEPVFEVLHQHLGFLVEEVSNKEERFTLEEDEQENITALDAQDDLIDLFAFEFDANDPLLSDTTESNEKFGIDHLFDEAELPPILAYTEAEFGDLFDTTKETEESHYLVETLTPANSTEDAELSDFWEEGAAAQAKEQFEPAEPIRALEENRFATFQDIFSDLEQPAPAAVELDGLYQVGLNGHSIMEGASL